MPDQELRPRFPKGKVIKLFCINAGAISKKNLDGTWEEKLGTGLELYETYTSPGLYTDKDVHECYWINEINGGEGKLKERFIVYK